MDHLIAVNQSPDAAAGQLDRRTFLQGGAMLMAGIATRDAHAASTVSARSAETQPADRQPIVRIGLIADAHYADKPPHGDRHYRASIPKMHQAVDAFNQADVDFTVELGDFIDAGDSVWKELDFLKRIEAEYARLKAPRHYVLGNHCVGTLTKKEFLEHTNAFASRPDVVSPVVGQRVSSSPENAPYAGPSQTPLAYYAFDVKGFRFLVLDACYRPDGTPYCRGNYDWTCSYVPPAQQQWLQEQLRQTNRPVIVFIHQRLDTDGSHGVVNAADVRRLLEASGRVRVVFQGHDHRGADERINDIRYYTLSAMVTGPAPATGGCGVAECFADGTFHFVPVS